MLKQFFWGSLLIFVVMMVMPASLAVPLDAVPHPWEVNQGWVTDMAGLLSEATEKQLNQCISTLYRKNGIEVVVVTVPETSPSETPQQFATDLFNRWKIDQSQEKPGVLILISQNERRVEVKTGIRTILLLPNNRVSHIINSLMTPQFKQGKFEAGTVAGTQAIVQALQTKESVTHPSPNRFPLWLRGLILLGVMAGVPAIALAVDRVLKPKPGTMSYQEGCDRYPDYCRSTGYGGGYRGSSCRGGGGGGGYYGGGAGGSW